MVGTWFTSVLEESESPRYADYESGSCPTAEGLSRHLINLPTHLRVQLEDVEAISAALIDAASPAAEQSRRVSR